MRQEEYDRVRVLDAAARARSRGQWRRAIALLRRVLAVEPANGEVHLKLAPLLAETNEGFDAWLHYRTAARACIRDDRLDRAHAIYREACHHLPHNLDAWLEMAELERRRGRIAEAFRVLLDARLHFRGRAVRPQAIHVLRRARALAPTHLDTLLDLVGLLARSGQREEALLLLERAAPETGGADRRRLARARFRITWDLADLWHWLRSRSHHDPFD